LKPCVSIIINGKLVGNLFIFVSVWSSFILMSENTDEKKSQNSKNKNKKKWTGHMTIDRSNGSMLYNAK